MDDDPDILRLHAQLKAGYTVTADNTREVNPWMRVHETGEIHTPLINLTDPRENLPPELRTQLANEVIGRDPRTVKGWIQAVTTEE